MGMHLGLFESVNPVLVMAPITGTAVVTGPAIDMQGWNGVAFTPMIGALASATSTTIVASVSDTSNFAASTAVGTVTAGTAINTYDVLDLWRPNARYVRAVITPNGTAAIGVIAHQYSRTGVLPASGTANLAGSATVYTRVQLN